MDPEPAPSSVALAKCPLCTAPATHLEHLSHGWEFCNCCGRAFCRNADGDVLHQTETHHSPPEFPIFVEGSSRPR